MWFISCLLQLHDEDDAIPAMSLFVELLPRSGPLQLFRRTIKGMPTLYRDETYSSWLSVVLLVGLLEP